MIITDFDGIFTDEETGLLVLICLQKKRTCVINRYVIYTRTIEEIQIEVKRIVTENVKITSSQAKTPTQ